MTNCFIRGWLELQKVNFEKNSNLIFKLPIELVWKFFQGISKNWQNNVTRYFVDQHRPPIDCHYNFQGISLSTFYYLP